MLRTPILAALLAAFIATIAIATVSAGAQAGQQPQRTVSATLAPATATVGDRLTLTIVVGHPISAQPAGPGYGGDFGGLEIIAIAPPRIESHDDIGETTLTYTLTAFHTGEITVPAQTISLTDNGATSTLTTAPLHVTIASVLTPGDTTLRPLKPQLSIDGGAPPFVVPALFVAVFVALTACGYILHARAVRLRPPPLAARAAAVSAPPAATARHALDAVAASRLSDTDVAEYYARIATTVRAYLTARFDFPAYAMTRTELDVAMAAAGIDIEPADLTSNLLEQCDAAEFAQRRPDHKRRTSDLTSAYEIVALTTPPPEAASGG
jgi:hypothetical protein